MSNKTARRRTRQSLGQVPRSSQRHKLKTYLAEHYEPLIKAHTEENRAALQRLFYVPSPEILACFQDYPERYRKIKAFDNSLWVRGSSRSIDVRRPFLRGLSAVNGRWAVARPNGEIVKRFHDWTEAEWYIVRVNRHFFGMFHVRVWWYLVDGGLKI